MIERKPARLHALVTGRVQGVGFRYFVQANASQLNLTGWVRNRWNGGVEVLAEGAQPELEKLLQAIGRGPRAGTTRDVQFEWHPGSGEFSGFNIRRTA